MKKVLLGLIFCGTAATAFAQVSVQELPAVSEHRGIITEPVTGLEPTKGRRADNPLSKWYNWMDAAASNIGIEFTFYNNSTIFPDSSVKQIFGDGAGGTMLGYVGMHGEGVTFDPKAPVFQDSALSKYHQYRWDSVIIFLQSYKRYPENPNPDTLIIQYYTSAAPSGIVKSTYTGGDKLAFVRYDYKKNLGTGAKKEFRYLLTDADTTSTFRGILLPVDENNPAGFVVPKDGLCALTCSYRPGHPYALGDTIDERWVPAPTKRLNHLKLAIGHDLSKTSDESYNNGLRIVKHQRYNIPPAPNSGDWRGSYIAGDAWNAYNEYLYASFHVTTDHFNVGLEEGGMQAYDMNEIYPNPANGSATLAFTLGRSEKVNITLFNSLGQPVQTIANGNFPAGPNSLGLNTNSLEPGMYFYTIQAGSFSKTLKLTVAR